MTAVHDRCEVGKEIHRQMISGASNGSESDG
jgi:hypothetical protein